MALNAETYWEVRTSGNSANGAGFYDRDPGTSVDYSQQDAAQLTLTDGATSGTGVTTFTSTTGGFTAAMAGNLLYISSGTNELNEYFEITAYTDTNTVTLDRSPDDGVGGVSGANFKVGGASDHPQTIIGSLVIGNTVYVEGGSYNNVGANDYVISTSVGSTTAEKRIKFIGYKVSTARTVAYGSDRPDFDGASSETNVAVIGASYYCFENIIFKDATATGIKINGSYNIALKNCRVTGCVTGLSRDSSSACTAYMYFCEIDNNSGSAMYLNTYDTSIILCYIHDNAGAGIYKRYGTSALYITHLINNIIDTNTADGVRLGTDGSTALQHVLIGNISYNNTGATTSGFHIGTTNAAAFNPMVTVLYNNVAMNNGDYGFYFHKDQPYMFADFNAYYGNTDTGFSGLTAGANDVTGDPKFTGAADNPPDFTLDTGSPLLNTGFPDADWAANIGLAAGRY